MGNEVSPVHGFDQIRDISLSVSFITLSYLHTAIFHEVWLTVRLHLHFLQPFMKSRWTNLALERQEVQNARLKINGKSTEAFLCKDINVHQSAERRQGKSVHERKIINGQSKCTWERHLWFTNIRKSMLCAGNHGSNSYTTHTYCIDAKVAN